MPFVFVQHRQVIEAHGYIGMLDAERPFLDRQRFLREGNGLAVPAIAMKLDDLSRQRLRSAEIAFLCAGNTGPEQRGNYGYAYSEQPSSGWPHSHFPLLRCFDKNAVPIGGWVESQCRRALGHDRGRRRTDQMGMQHANAPICLRFRKTAHSVETKG